MSSTLNCIPRGAAILTNSGKGYQQPTFGSVFELLSARAEEQGDACALIAPDRKALSYSRLLHQCKAAVSSLRSSNIQRNDRVAVVLPNGPEMAVAFLAISCGATCAPLNPSYRAEEFDFYISDLNARALVVSSDVESPAREVARRRNVPIIELKSRSEEEAGIFEFVGEEKDSDITGSFAQPSDIALVLHTSGTTSRPKIVPLKHYNICCSGHNVATALNLTESDRCLNVMPLFHIHGLVAAVMASLTTGGSVVCTPGFDPEKFFGWLELFKPTWYTAVPTIHQAVLSRATSYEEIIKKCPLRLIRSSSASLPQPVMEELERVFQTQVIEAYGMTEAAHQMASNPLAPLVRKANSVGVSAGPDIAIMDESGNLLPPGQTGEVVIRGKNVTDGYENNDKANRESFVNGWFRTGDQGRVDNDGYLFLSARLKEIINRGGEKISPREVDDVLARHPAVDQVVTFGVPHPTLGEEVAAAVVLRKEAKAGPVDLRAFAADRLSDFKVPKQILILDVIPKGATGKLQRIGLADKLADKLAAQLEVNFVMAKDPVETALVEIWKGVLRLDQVGVRDDFQVLGGDSLAMMTMLLEVEERFKTDIPVDRFLRCPTIETISNLLQDKGASSASAEALTVKTPTVVTDSRFGGLKNRLLQYLALYAPGFKTTRVSLHKMRGVRIGKNVSIGVDVLIETAYPQLVSIGDNVSIGMRAVIIGHLRDSTDRARAYNTHTVRIEDDVYIGPGVIVLPNVTIGRGAVVSAGSVVSRPVPPKTLVRGNPAEPIAQCGVSLGGGVSYEQFLRHLTPIKQNQAT